MTRAVIVQARYGSSRFPGKVLLPLGARPELAIVLERCARIPGADVVVCAVSDDRASDPVAEAAAFYGAVVVRGPQHDVLARYERAARVVGANVVMRVTSDCPLIDPATCGEVLAALEERGADYACNNMPALWPHGLDCDAFWADHLARAAREARAPYDREHVTPWLRRQPKFRRINLDGPGGGVERHRWTLDHPEDYEFFTALWSAMGERAGDAPLGDILATLAEHPEIVAINRPFIDEGRLVNCSCRAEVRISSTLLAAA
jgi:spore coat polysaccharide biosynthesis protein SpsF